MPYIFTLGVVISYILSVDTGGDIGLLNLEMKLTLLGSHGFHALDCAMSSGVGVDPLGPRRVGVSASFSPRSMG